MMTATGWLRPAERRVAVGVVVAALLAAGLVGPRGADAADPPTPVVYVAFSHNFPDALTGSVAAALDCAPLLLVPKDPPLPEATQAELDRLDPQRIVILGGEAVVSTAMEDELGNYTTPADNVDRLAGDDRFGTAADISQALAERACDADTLDGLDSTDFKRAGQGTIPVFPPAPTDLDGPATIARGPARIVLPEDPTEPSFSFGFTLPDDYVAGDPVTLDVLWRIDETGCDVVLADIALFIPTTHRIRAGQTGSVAGILDGLGTIAAPAAMDQWTLMSLDVDFTDPLQPGDTITSTIFRYADGSNDTCTEAVDIGQVVARYGS